MSRGDVYWFEHPDAGRHPALVLTRQSVIAVLTHVLVAYVTRNARGIASEVALDTDDGMPAPCVVTLDNLATVPKAQLTERITSLDGARMHQVCQALSIATDCRA